MGTMRRSVVGLVVVWSAVAAAQPAEPPRVVSVSGTVEAKTAPDQIIWTITLTDSDRHLGKAKEKNDEKIKTVLALAKQLGIAEADIETGWLDAERDYDHKGFFKRFEIKRTVTIRQRDLKRFDEFLDALVAGTDLGVTFRLESSRRHEARTEARRKALLVAKEKATAMASALGAKIGRVCAIAEHPQSTTSWSNITSNWAPISHGEPAVDADADTDTFVPGAITVKATVYVTFALE